MVGLLDILQGLLGGGQQQAPQGMLSGMQNQQPQGLLAQQQGMGQQGGIPPNFLQNVSRALIASGQPSMYKTSTGTALLNGLNAGLTGNASPYEMQAIMNNPDKQGLEKMVAMAQLKKASDPSWKETRDAFGNPLVYNADNPTQTMPLGNGTNPFSPTTQTPQAGQQQTTGDDFLKTLQPNIASQVKALADGKMQFPGGFALKSPYWQQMISAVSQYDPSFDAVNYNARSKTRGDFTSGKSAQNITALNTAMSHLSTLKDSYDALGNSDYPAYNSMANWVGNQFGDKNTQTNTANVSADATAVSHELAKVFRSTGMSEGEIKDWENKINTSSTPSQSNAIIQSALDLMNGRMQAIGQQYNQGMGTTKDPLELLSPEAQRAYQKLSGGKPSANQPTNVGGVVSYQDYFR